MKRIFFPGSFDPFTIGHASLVERALTLFDEVVVAIGINENKAGWIPIDERYQALCDFYHDNPRVSVTLYKGITADHARRLDAAAILRGVRSHKDFEYELQMADINRQLTGIETVVLFTEPRLAPVSSSVVRELAHFGKDITPFLPAGLHYPSTNKQPQS